MPNAQYRTHQTNNLQKQRRFQTSSDADTSLGRWRGWGVNLVLVGLNETPMPLSNTFTFDAAPAADLERHIEDNLSELPTGATSQLALPANWRYQPTGATSQLELPANGRYQPTGATSQLALPANWRY